MGDAAIPKFMKIILLSNYRLFPDISTINKIGPTQFWVLLLPKLLVIGSTIPMIGDNVIF